MTFLHLVPTGMNDPEHPGWGSWAGRHGPQEKFPDKPYFWASQTDAWRGVTNRDNTLARWSADLQNDFRARLDWCVKPLAQANHPPVVRVAGGARRTVKPGETVGLDASASTDPDANRCTSSGSSIQRLAPAGKRLPWRMRIPRWPAWPLHEFQRRWKSTPS